MRKNKNSEELESFMVFVGNWKVEGANLSSAPNSPDTLLNGTQAVVLMEGGKFIEAHWKYDYEGNGKHYGISIIGKAEEKSIIECHNFDNIGFHRVYDSNFEQGTWKLTGKSERATIEFDKSGKSYKEFWEIKKDRKWESLCERKAVKVL